MYSLHKISVSVLLIFYFSSASGGNPCLITAGAPEAGTGYSCIMRPGFWSSFHNQALLSENTNLSTGVNYENRFGIKELGTASAAVIIPSGKASIGAIWSRFGYKDFIRQSAGIACGLKIAEGISTGIQVDFLSEKTPGEYSGRQSLTFEAGVLLTPADNIRIGIHLFNPVPNSMRRRYLPSSLRAGAGIKLNPSLFAGAEVQMSTGEKVILKTGFEYETAKKFWLRGGFNSDNTSFGFGFGYLMKKVKIDLGFVTHERLGVTSSASIIFHIR